MPLLVDRISELTLKSEALSTSHECTSSDEHQRDVVAGLVTEAYNFLPQIRDTYLIVCFGKKQEKFKISR